MAQKIGAKGGQGGKVWDDEAYDNVTKINVRGGFQGIQYVQFEYVKSGQTIIGSLHGSSGKGFTQAPFEINPKDNEHLVSVEGTYDEATGVIQALRFKTNLKASDMMGDDEKGTKFSLEVKGKKIVGFHGSAETNMNSLGAYFMKAPPTKLARHGGSGGNQWDDGSNYNGVRKVSFTLGDGERSQIRQITFDYDKSGVVETKRYGMDQGRHDEFVVDYPNEYIISVEGTCGDIGTNPIHDRVMSLAFKTSKGRISKTFGNVGSRKFVLESNGNALVGFHGQAGYCLDALGAYFSFPSPPPTKVNLQGGSGGNYWDDGPNYDGVRKVSFTLGGGENTQIRQIRFDYDKCGLVETRGHGMDQGQHDEFVIDYPNEYIISVEGTCADIGTNPIHDRVMSLAFKTSNGRTSKIFGNVGGRNFLFESKGNALVGFHGRSGYSLDALGAYFAASPSPPPTEKLQAKGGEGGDPWDDGAFDGVRKVYVGQGLSGITAIKFVYEKDSDIVEGKERGKVTRAGYEEPFEVDYPSEYIIAVEGCYDKILGSEGGIITMVTFKTNKRTSPPFGMETPSTFVLGKEGHKIVGFHGNATHELQQLGVHVVPISQ